MNHRPTHILKPTPRLDKLLKRQEELQQQRDTLYMELAPIATSWWPWHIIRVNKGTRKLGEIETELKEVAKRTLIEVKKQTGNY